MKTVDKLEKPLIIKSLLLDKVIKEWNIKYENEEPTKESLDLIRTIEDERHFLYNMINLIYKSALK